MCDRRYHGQWSVARLAAAAGIDEPAMRKRLQRIRDKLRRQIERSASAADSNGSRLSDVQPGIDDIRSRSLTRV